MANPKHLAFLEEGINPRWNKWREKNDLMKPDLQGAELHGAQLHGAELHGAQHRLVVSARQPDILWSQDIEVAPFAEQRVEDIVY